MPRNPLAALVQLLVALPLGVVGTVMFGWAVMAYFKIEWGFDTMLWAARNSPFELDMAPERLANAAIQDGAKIAIGVAGFILYRIGAALLRAARLNMRPASPRRDGPDVIAPSAGKPAAHSASPPRPAATASAGSTVFARTLLSDDHPPATPSRARSADVALHPATHAPHAEASPRHAAFATHAGLDADLAGWARLIGKNGQFTPQQRAALAHLTPEQLALVKKLIPDPAKAIKWAVIGVVALFFVLPFVLSVLGFILTAIFGN